MPEADTEGLAGSRDWITGRRTRLPEKNLRCKWRAVASMLPAKYPKTLCSTGSDSRAVRHEATLQAVRSRAAKK